MLPFSIDGVHLSKLGGRFFVEKLLMPLLDEQLLCLSHFSQNETSRCKPAVSESVPNADSNLWLFPSNVF